MGEEKENEESSVPSSPKSETPIRAIFCLKQKEQMKHFDDTEECFILEFDPFDSPIVSKISLDKKKKHNHGDDSPDLSIIAEKGPVACRDYPHSRHLCVKFPFKTTPHESYCDMCYCNICDSSAPCNFWETKAFSHCDADNTGFWKELKKVKRHVKTDH